eukprot:SAG11_NODE_23915_length_381_cov_0.904255_1_plen_126_part_11
MGKVHAVLEPLLAQMFVERPADPAQYIVQYLCGENKSGAARMAKMEAELEAAQLRIAELEAAAATAAPVASPTPLPAAAGDSFVKKQAAGEEAALISVLGGPATGKSTQCEKLAHEHGFTHVSVGR